MVLQGIVLAMLLRMIWDYLSPETKARLKQLVPMHHGEEGFWTTLAGVLSNNPNLISGGVTLMVDDWQDRPFWLEDIKNRINSILNNIQKSLNQIRFNYNNSRYNYQL